MWLTARKILQACSMMCILAATALNNTENKHFIVYFAYITQTGYSISYTTSTVNKHTT